MALDRKYLIGEDSTGEFGQPVEHLPLAEDLSIVSTTLSINDTDMQGYFDENFDGDESHKFTYSSGDIDFIELFRSASQITGNRRAKIAFTYSSGDVATMVKQIFDTNGTTVLKTITHTFSYSSGDLSTVTQVVA